MLPMGMINNKYKTSICRHFGQTGLCQLGAKCHFAHGKEELRKVTDPISMASTIAAMTPIPSGFSMMTINNYKTVKCKYFEKGFCKYNQNCSFAHGDIDIRMPTQESLPQSSIPTYQTSSIAQYRLMDPAIQNQIAQQQIQYLIQQMEAYHSSNSILLVNIKKAQELNTASNTQAAAQILYEIIQRPDRTEKDTEKYNEFLATIQQLGNALYQSMQLSISQSSPPGFGSQNIGSMGAYSTVSPQGMGYGNTYQNGGANETKTFGSK